MIDLEDADHTISVILGKTYGMFVATYMPQDIIRRWSGGQIKTEADLARQIWYTTSGGTTAAAKAKEISAAIPGFVTESDLSTW